jgi:hypothetical protein
MMMPVESLVVCSLVVEMLMTDHFDVAAGVVVVVLVVAEFSTMFCNKTGARLSEKQHG